jgi:hypothetical protein
MNAVLSCEYHIKKETQKQQGKERVEHIFLSTHSHVINKFTHEVNRLYKIKVKLVKHIERAKPQNHTFCIPWIDGMLISFIYVSACDVY